MLVILVQKRWRQACLLANRALLTSRLVRDLVSKKQVGQHLRNDTHTRTYTCT